MQRRIRLGGAALALTLGSVAAAQVAGAPGAVPGAGPAAVVRAADLAVQGDSAPRVAARWTERLRRALGDREAQLGLATLARLTYDYETAERRYGALDADTTRPPADAHAVYARLGLAQARDASGLIERATADYRRAVAGARALGLRAAEAEARLGLAFMLATVEGVEVGMAHLDSAARLLPPGADALRGDLHRRRSVLLAVSSAPGAQDEARRCVALARRTRDARLEGHCWRALALDLRLRGAPDSAFVVHELAMAANRRARDRSMLAETLIRQSDILRGRGDFGRAKAYLDEALVEARAAKNLLAEASAHNGIGSLLLRLKDYGPASESLREAMRMFTAQGDSAGAMLARQFLPTLYAGTGDLARAAAETETVLAWFRRTGEVPNEFDLLRTRASIAMRARDWARAEAALDTAAALAASHGMTSSHEQLDLDRGRLALYRGRLGEAERHFTERLAELDTASHVARHETRARLAEIYARRGELDRAARALTAAGEELDRWRATLADRELRLLAFQATPAEDDENHASAARVIALLAGGGRAEAAFELAERRRARELADRLVRAEALRRDADGAPARASTAGVRRSAAEIRAALPDERTALVEFVSAGDDAPLTAFVLTRDRLQGLVLPEGDSLTPRVARFVARLESGGDAEALAALARSLGAAVLDPVVAALPASVSHLIVVPDGALHRLPFDALRLADGRWALERFTIGLAPSATTLATLLARPGHAHEEAEELRLLAFGDPVFDGEDAAAGRDALVFRSAFDSAGGLARLPASGDEARLVARFAPQGEARLRDSATGAFLKRTDLTGYHVLHFATHALVDERSATRTALALAPGGGEDGFVTPGDIASLRLGADLVVLSACRSAGGVVVDGEGVQGLTGPFLEAGARSVVASGWRVGDRATVGLVEDFYRELAAGRTVGEALRQAKLAALERGAPAAEWAAFTVVGDPSVRLPLVAPPARGHTAALAGVVAAAVAAAAWMVYSMRRRPKLERA